MFLQHQVFVAAPKMFLREMRQQFFVGYAFFFALNAMNHSCYAKKYSVIAAHDCCAKKHCNIILLCYNYFAKTILILMLLFFVMLHIQMLADKELIFWRNILWKKLPSTILYPVWKCRDLEANIAALPPSLKPVYTVHCTGGRGGGGGQPYCQNP